MTLITPEDGVLRTTELLQSVQESLIRLRKQAEDLLRQLEAGEETNLVDGSKQIASVERLIPRAILKSSEPRVVMST